MSTFGEKLKIILYNNGWTQKQLADYLHYSDDAIRTWIKDISRPNDETKKIICERFAVPIQELLYDHFEIPRYEVIGKYIAYSPKAQNDSVHIVIDAYLEQNAYLHRFTQYGKIECSAIYVGDFEEWWHYREYEPWMIRHWNEDNGNVRRAY